MRLWSVRPPRFPHTDGPVGGRTMVFDSRHQTHPGIRRPARLIRQDRGPAVIILLAAVLLLWSPAETRADCPAAPLTSPDDLVISFRTGEGGPQAAPGALLTSTVKDGMLVYDGAAKVLKLCNGTSWITLQSTSGAGAAAGSVAGAVQFRGAGGNLAADDTNFVWDDTNNRLGIGTATPTVSIESTGQAIFGLGRIYDHNTNYTGFGHKSLVTNGTAYAIGQSSAGNTIINATAGQSVAVRIGGGATQPVSINSAGITFSSGTAGAPNASALLDMSSTTKGFLPPRMTTAQVTAIATPADGLIVYDSDTDTIKLRANGAWVDLLAGAGSEADPQVGTLTANKWCSANAGGTAIDCTADAPATGAAGSASEVQFRNSGTGAFAADSGFYWDNTNKYLMIDHTNWTGLVTRSFNAVAGVGAAPSLVLVRGRGTPAVPTPPLTNDILGMVAFRSYQETGGVEIRGYSAEDQGTGLRGGYLSFLTTPVGTAVGVERMRIAADGNVGIGTTNPTSDLQVGLTTGDYIQVDASPSALKYFYNGTTTPRVAIGSVAGNGMVSFAQEAWGSAATQGAGIGISAIKSLGLYTSNGTALTERVRIDSAGNVGVGTTSPTGRLHVATAGASAMFVDAYANASAVQLRRANGTLAAPTAVLSGDVIGSVSFAGYGATAFSGGKADMRAIASENWTDTATGVNLVFATTPTGSSSAAERVRIDQAGNVGIGTTNPQSRLHVSGGIQLGDDTATCPGAANVKVGTLRYNSGNLQVCGTGGWANTSGGGGTLASLTDTNITSPANNSLLRYDSGTSKWINVQLQDGLGATTMVTGWPDAIICYGGTGMAVLKAAYKANSGGMTYSTGWTNSAGSDNLFVSFNSSGVWASTTNFASGWAGYYETNCNSSANTLTTLYAAGRAFNFIGGSSTPGGANTQVQFNDSGAFGGDSKLVFNKTTGQLTVTGNIAATSTTATSTLSSSTSLSGGVAQVYLNNTGAGGTNWSINAGNTATGGGLGANLGIAEGSNYRLVIAQGGNVGIGTTSPGQKLTVAGSIESTSGGVKFPDGTTQTTAFGKTMTIRTNVSTFTLANGASTGRTAYCNAGELATGGGCQDSGYKDFYIFRPESGGYSCFWYNTSGASRTYTDATVYVNCLK